MDRGWQSHGQMEIASLFHLVILEENLYVQEIGCVEIGHPSSQTQLPAHKSLPPSLILPGGPCIL